MQLCYQQQFTLERMFGKRQAVQKLFRSSVVTYTWSTIWQFKHENWKSPSIYSIFFFSLIAIWKQRKCSRKPNLEPRKNQRKLQKNYYKYGETELINLEAKSMGTPTASDCFRDPHNLSCCNIKKAVDISPPSIHYIYGAQVH